MGSEVQGPYPAFELLHAAHLYPEELSMIRILTVLCAALLAGSAGAQTKDKDEPSKKQVAQQERMKSCNAQAAKKDMKGDERKAFMSKCLSAGGAKKDGDKELTAQQKKMRSCNAQAAKKEMKGDERKAFMSKCLKADSGDLTAQQERMVTCNQQASRRDLKGDARQDFMSQCLRGDSAAAGR
jgi:hypothetical protein